MINWNNLDTLTSFKELSEVERVNLAEVMSGENGAERVKDYSVPMTEDLTYNYAAKAVDDSNVDIDMSFIIIRILKNTVSLSSRNDRQR